jgi:hypothetical protein
VEVVTQLAFYCGWPKVWSTFPLIREVCGVDDGVDPNRLSWFQHLAIEVPGEGGRTEWCELEGKGLVRFH